MTKSSTMHVTGSGWVESADRPKSAIGSWTRTAEFVNDKLTIDYARSWFDDSYSSEELKLLRGSMPESSVSARYADVCYEIVD